MPTITVKVTAGADDGFRNDYAGYGVFSRVGPMVDIGRQFRYDWLAEAAFRFAGVMIPKGSTIQSAKLKLLAAQNLSKPTVNWKIQAEAADNPAPIPDGMPGWNEYETRPKTVAAILWHDVQPWAADTWYESPNFASVIQEIINRPGWIAGNAIQIFVRDDGSHDSAAAETKCIRRAWTYEQGPTFAAELEITYGEAPPPTHTLTISASAGGTTDPLPGPHVYDEGTVASVLATADIGYVFDHWELDGVDVGSANPYSVTMDADHSLHAVFAEEAPPPKGTLEVHAYEI